MAYININEKSKLVRQLQNMLQSLSRWTDDMNLNVAVDGSYDENTFNAVMYFQKKYSLPQTGIVDYATWTAIAELYDKYEKKYGSVTSISPFPPTSNYVVATGERSDLVFIIQIMLNELRRNYDTYGFLPLSGRFDLAMEKAVEEFQKAAGIETSGTVNRITWNRLAEEYNTLTQYSE